MVNDEEGVVGSGGEGGVRRRQELFTVKTLLGGNNTEDNVDSHNIGQVAESATKRDNS